MKSKIFFSMFVILFLSQMALADTIIINNGVRYTNNTTIMVNISVDGQNYGFINDTNGANFVNITANVSTNWTLNSTTDGVKWFWLKRNASDLNYTANTSIILDRTFPIITITTPSNDSVYFPDEIASIEYQITANDMNVSYPVNDTIYYNVTPSIVDKTIGRHQVFITAIDNASNIATKSINYTVVERVESSGSITRILNSSLMVSGGTIIINLTSSSSGFRFYMINETIPSRFNFIFLNSSGNLSEINITNKTQGDNVIYTFTAIGAFTNLSYSITTSNTTYRQYSIYGEFVDEDRKHGNIPTSYFNLIREDIGIYQRYDSNGNNRLEKGEVINGVVDYFRSEIGFSDVIRLIIKYISGGTF